MELFTQLLNALWAQDYETLANPSMIGMLYFVLFMILFLENGLLPAAFLPGDSLLVLVGVLIAKGAMGFPETFAAHRRRQPRLLAKLYSGGVGWVIRGSCKTGCHTCLRTITSVRITCFISMGSPRC